MKTKKTLLALVAGLLLAGGVASYAGMWSGLPAATSSPSTGNATTLPLTGSEVGAFDTGLSGGRNPQTETISIDQIKTYVFGNDGTVGVTGNSTATATAGAATCNAARCVVTSEALTTTPGSAYTLVLSSSNILATSVVQVAVGQGTNTGTGVTLKTVSPRAGAADIVVRNEGMATPGAFNGTLKFGVLVVN